MTIVITTTNLVYVTDNMFPQIFPLSLNSLLALSDRVQHFSTEINGTRPCHGCHKQAASLMKCARCSLFWYCNGVSLLSELIVSEWNANFIKSDLSERWLE